MSNWKNSSFAEAENTPDAKTFVFRCVSQTASPFSVGSTITLHSSPVRALQNVFSQSAFCWVDNIEECLAYLSKELIALGLPSLFTDDSFEESPASGFNLVALINCTHYLLQLHWKNMAKVDELESARFKSFSEQDCMRSSQFKLQEQAETLEREIAALQAKDQQAQKNIRNLNSLLKTNKEEVVKLQNITSSRAAQHAHDMKRKEQELSKLKEKMHHHLTDKKDKRMSIDILNQIGRSDGRRSLWRTGKTESRREGEMYKVLTSNYETQLKELALDNAELKRALNRVKREMSEFPSSQEKLRQQGSLQSLVEEEDTLDVSHDTDRKHLTDGFLQQWTSLKDHLQKLEMAGVHKSPAGREDEHAVSATDHDKEMAKLKLELEQSKQIVREQQQVLQDQLAIEKEDLAQGPDLLEEMEWFNKERQLFEEQRANFKKEREAFTEAAIRLGRERNLFEEERAQLRKEQFFNLTPFRERRAKPRLRLRTACTMASPDQECPSAFLAGHRMGRWTIHSHRPLGTLSPPPKSAQPRGAISRRYSLPASHELCHALGVIPERSFRIAPTVPRLKRSHSPTRRRESSTQTRNDSGWMSAALFMNESDDSLYIGPLHSQF